jgi:hypothetical protein
MRRVLGGEVQHVGTTTRSREFATGHGWAIVVPGWQQRTAQLSEATPLEEWSK